MIEPGELTAIWRQHSARLLIIARAIGEPAEDAVQEAFVALAQQKSQPDDVLAWLVVATHNRLLQWRRSDLRRQQREQSLAAVKPWFSSAAEELDQRLDAQQATEALIELPAETREIIVMHLWGGMTFRQIAAIVDCSLATANRRYQQGLNQLRLKWVDPINRAIS